MKILNIHSTSKINVYLKIIAEGYKSKGQRILILLHDGLSTWVNEVANYWIFPVNFHQDIIIPSGIIFPLEHLKAA